jgi:hypothetical protein
MSRAVGLGNRPSANRRLRASMGCPAGRLRVRFTGTVRTQGFEGPPETQKRSGAGQAGPASLPPSTGLLLNLPPARRRALRRERRSTNPEESICFWSRSGTSKAPRMQTVKSRQEPTQWAQKLLPGSLCKEVRLTPALALSLHPERSFAGPPPVLRRNRLHCTDVNEKDTRYDTRPRPKEDFAATGERAASFGLGLDCPVSD